MSISIPILNLQPQYQAIKEEIQTAINRVLESGQFILGKEVAQFETEVAKHLGVKYAVGVNSGTDALMIGLRALGIGAGDEVITTPFSFFATAESISNVGAKPVFVDINPESFNLEPEAITQAINSSTKAIMPVHLYGNPAAMTAILEIAAKYNLKVIEDCAQSFGAIYTGSCQGCNNICKEKLKKQIQGKYTGAIGDVGAFSFFPTKNLGAYGDGGLITTNNEQIAEQARILRVHGAKNRYQNEILGYNSRLDAIQAAILRVKLKYIKDWNRSRRQVAAAYNQFLKDIPEIITPILFEGHVFHQYTLRILNGKRDQVKQALAEQGIASMIYYPIPQDRLPVYLGQYPPNPISNQLGQEVLSLPIWAELETETIKTIAQAIKSALKS